MIADEVNVLQMNREHQLDSSICEKIKMLNELEKKGIIESPTPQTALRYPTVMIFNQRDNGCCSK